MNIDQIEASIRGNGWKNRLFYMASVYSLWPDGPESAWEHARHHAAKLMERGILVYSPIAHSHPIDTAANGGSLGWSHDQWMIHCRATFRLCGGLIVCASKLWHESKGVQMEVGWAADLDMPTYIWNLKE